MNLILHLPCKTFSPLRSYFSGGPLKKLIKKTLYLLSVLEGTKGDKNKGVAAKPRMLLSTAQL
jgi:hypothetical protein